MKTNERPLSITIVGWLFVCVGCGGALGSMWKSGSSRGMASVSGSTDHELLDLALAITSGIMAGVGGAFVLRGHNWARWVLVAWMAFHIVLSILHSPIQLLVHCVLFAGLLYLLFCRSASAYLRRVDRSAVEARRR